MRDPNAKTLVNKALADEMRASARMKKPASSGSVAVPDGPQHPEGESTPPSRPQP